MKKREDTHIKNFLMGSTRVPSLLYVTEWQDPTYIGFDITFDFLGKTEVQYNDYEGISQGLLMDPIQPSSAVQYLKNINEPARAQALEKFIKILRELTFYAPWHFQSISGLDKVFQIDPTKNFRAGEDTIITINMLEGFDLKITMLLDLYKKAAWDSIYHRWMLPENMRQFKVTIVLSDYREMQKTKGLTLVDPNLNNEKTSDNASAVEEAQTIIKNKISQSIYSISNQVLSDSETTAINPLDYPQLILELDLCEFDILSKAPPYVAELSNAAPPEMATQQLIFKVGLIRESAIYDILGVNLSDTEIRKSLTANSGRTEKLSASNILKILEGKAKNFANTILTGLYLGNIYDFSIADIQGSVSNLVDRAMKDAGHIQGKQDMSTTTSIKKLSTNNIYKDEQTKTPIKRDLGNIGFYGPPSI